MMISSSFIKEPSLLREFALNFTCRFGEGPFQVLSEDLGGDIIIPDAASFTLLFP